MPFSAARFPAATVKTAAFEKNFIIFYHGVRKTGAEKARGCGILVFPCCTNTPKTRINTGFIFLTP